jgi:ABC-type histidine transport system ATPase subunit
MDVSNEIMFLEGGIIIEKGPPKEIIMNPKSERIKKFLSRISREGEES